MGGNTYVGATRLRVLEKPEASRLRGRLATRYAHRACPGSPRRDSRRSEARGTAAAAISRLRRPSTTSARISLLTSCQAGCVQPGRRPRPSRDVACATRAQATRDDGGRRRGTELGERSRAPLGERPRSRRPPARALPRTAGRGRPRRLRLLRPPRRARAHMARRRAGGAALRCPHACAMPAGRRRRNLLRLPLPARAPQLSPRGRSSGRPSARRLLLRQQRPWRAAGSSPVGLG